MSELKIRPALRLVGADDAPDRPGQTALIRAPFWSGDGAAAAIPAALAPSSMRGRRESPEAAVRKENIAAAGLSATDARWVLAVRVAESLEGGRAAVLTPEKRRRLVALATRMGLRPFDANLVIAIVQDSARSGERPTGPEVAGRLSLIPAPAAVPAEADGVARSPSVWEVAGPVAAAVALGVVLLRAMIGWVTGG